MSLRAEFPAGLRIAVIGSGPAGLMAADRLASEGIKVTIYEKRRGLGRKLLIAGSSGLNITHAGEASSFHPYYTGPRAHFEKLFQVFPPEAWIAFIEKELKTPTFLGSSRRYFVESEGMKASGLLKSWTDRLKSLGVDFLPGHELKDFETQGKHVYVTDDSNEKRGFNALCLALGGGSWEPDESPLRWTEVLLRHGLEMNEFQPENAGYEIDWPEALLKEAEGKPLKNIALTTSKGSMRGELVITRYGLEGTPVYTLGVSGTAFLDLLPGMSEEELLRKLYSVRENLSPIRRIKRQLKLGPAADALIFHLLPKEDRDGLENAARALKKFPLELKRSRPLAEAISSSGGLKWSELDESLMLKKFPGVFAAGEMIDWTAPTGGYLIQGSVSQGFLAGASIVNYLRSSR